MLKETTFAAYFSCGERTRVKHRTRKRDEAWWKVEVGRLKAGGWRWKVRGWRWKIEVSALRYALYALRFLKGGISL